MIYIKYVYVHLCFALRKIFKPYVYTLFSWTAVYIVGLIQMANVVGVLVPLEVLIKLAARFFVLAVTITLVCSLIIIIWHLLMTPRTLIANEALDKHKAAWPGIFKRP